MVTGSAGEAFAAAAGAAPGLVDVRRVQYLAKIEAGKVAELRASAARAAAGYSLVSWTGDVPEEYLGPLAHVINAFEDAPRGENVEPEAWDADRVRERTGAHVRAGLLRNHSVAALHDATGEMAAYTGIIVDPEAPSWGFQELTAVTREHRGHRLGLLVKTAMLELLAEVEPQVELVMTSNAAANDHMIAVNQQLGYEVAGPGWRFYAAPVAELLGRSVVEAEAAQVLGVALPVLGDPDVQVEVDPRAEQRLDLAAGPAADVLQPLALGADDDRLLARPLDVDLGVHVDQVRLPLARAHLLDQHRDRVRELVADPSRAASRISSATMICSGSSVRSPSGYSGGPSGRWLTMTSIRASS